MLKKTVKIIGILLLIGITILVVLFYRFSKPKSDEKIRAYFTENDIDVFIKQGVFQNFKYRILSTQKEIDTTQPTIVFIHGSIGSAFDFKNYLVDKDLNKKANLIAYDRIGYGMSQTGNVQESIAFEVEMLCDITKKFNAENTILIGYSYGGPIALASLEKYKKVILLAPAVYSVAEPMPWALNFYKWKATSWLLPKVWQAASKEKLSHKKDLMRFQNSWNKNTSSILSIHGNEDWIVPYENSLYLDRKFSSKQLELVTLNGAGHGLVWSHFDEIKKQIIQQLK